MRNIDFNRRFRRRLSSNANMNRILCTSFSDCWKFTQHTFMWNNSLDSVAYQRNRYKGPRQFNLSFSDSPRFRELWTEETVIHYAHARDAEIVLCLKIGESACFGNAVFTRLADKVDPREDIWA